MRIFYACQGVTVKPTRPGPTYYLNGVQSIGSDYDLSSVAIKDFGRSQVNQRLYGQTVNSITLDRVISNYTDESTRITGPLLHHVFSENSLIDRSTGPTSYKLGFLPKLMGSSITGTSLDILQYDLELIYQSESTILDASNAISSLKFMRSMLSGVSYDISVGGFLHEATTFSSKSMEIGAGDYTKSLVSTNDFNQTKFIKVINSDDFDKTNSILPAELLEVIDNNLFVDSTEVFGLTDISVNLSLSYTAPKDQGKWLGSTSSESNLWSSLQFPLTVDCSFSFKVRKTIDTAIYNRPDNFEKSQIRIVFRCRNHDGSSGNYFVINLGKHNYLSGISISGGSTGGDLVEYTYKYSNSNNDFLTYFTNINNFSIVDQSPTERY